MILTIWTEVQQQWAVRNAVKHGDTDATSLGAKFSQVLRETEAVYNLKPTTTLPSDHHIFYPSLAIHQATITTYTGLRAWVNNWRPALLRSVKDATEQGVTHQQAMEQYFPLPDDPTQEHPPD